MKVHPMTDTSLHRFLTVDLLRDILQSAGYRVAEAQTPDGAPILTSATNGLGFELRPMNPLPADAGATPLGAARFADATFRTAFKVQGELPLSLVNAWNASHRFCRLQLLGGDSPWLVFDMDIVALGGIHPDNLRAQIEIWDRLVVQLIVTLRQELPKLAKDAPVAEPQAAPEAASAA